jgi:hypothetical protein
MLAFALSGCGDEARIRVSARLVAPLTLEMLTVTVRDGHRVVHWAGADFKTGTDDPIPSSPEVETATSGPDLEISFRLESAGAVLSTGTVVLPRRTDWRWGVTVSAATTSPEAGCFGCFGSRAFDLAQAFRTPGRDSIWVVWSGNSISDPAIY